MRYLTAEKMLSQLSLYETL